MEIGCGSLRGGRHYIEYLEPGNYVGIDAQGALIRAGMNRVLTPDAIKEKSPFFIVNSDFDLSELPKIPDYSVSVSLWSHLNLEDIDHCLRSLRGSVSAGHVYFTSFFEKGNSNASEPAGAVDHVESHPHRNFEYSVEELSPLATANGFELEYVGDYGAENQMMLKFVAI